MPDWIDTVPVAALPGEGGKLFSYLDKRLALFRTPAGVFATDNRCPHEGYALVRGTLLELDRPCPARARAEHLRAHGLAGTAQRQRPLSREDRTRSVQRVAEIAPKAHLPDAHRHIHMDRARRGIPGGKVGGGVAPLRPSAAPVQMI